MKHIGLKIIACIFGIALWFYVVSARVTEMDLQIPLVFARLPESLAIASRPASQISITVRGKAIDLIRLKNANSNAARIIVDLHEAELGLERILLSEENFVAPDFPNVHYESASQIAALEIEIDTRISRSIPVHLNGTFRPKDGHTIVETPTISPDTIRIAGARDALTRIFEISTAEMSETELDSSQTFTVPLDFSKLPPYVYPSDSVANVSVSVQPLVKTSFEDIPVKLIGKYDYSSYALSPKTATVEISGGEGILSKLQKDSIELLIEFNRFMIEDTDSLSPTVRIRGKVRSFQVRPEKFYLEKIAPIDSAKVAAKDSVEVQADSVAAKEKSK